MFQKAYVILIIVFVGIFLAGISSKAGFSPSSLHPESEACDSIRTEFADPWTMPWNKRLNYWLCYPEYIDPA